LGNFLLEKTCPRVLAVGFCPWWEENIRMSTPSQLLLPAFRQKFHVDLPDHTTLGVAMDSFRAAWCSHPFTCVRLVVTEHSKNPL
jgi:hypothetical protein